MLKQWTKGLARAAGSLVLAAAVLAGPWAAGSVSAQAGGKPASDTYVIVTLGDSLTVGYEPGMNVSSKPYGFVDRLLEQGLLHGRTEVVNLGIAGLKTGGLDNYVQAITDERAITADGIQAGISDPRTGQIGREAAKAKAVIAEADLITITIGGNDMFELTKTAGSLNSEQLTGRIQELFQQYTTNVSRVVNNLHSISPEAEIILADQYNPIPQLADKAAYPKLLEASAAFTAHVEGLAKEFSQNGIQVTVAPVAKEFVGNEMTMTHILKYEDIHPTQYGYETMARVFANSIWGSYTKPEAVEAGHPMAIIVSGKTLNTPYKPVLVKNQNFVAVQDIVNAVGAKTVWSNKTSSATVTYGDKTVVITMGAKTVKVNGKSVSINTPAFLHKVGKEHKTYVPLAVLAEGLGFDVQYNAKLRTVFINP
ncbi:stalk domain-containing protein [Paenibacillus lemnae]|uniref:Copper amine oxidase n=1 Tax=Paenibacillus lemnae TaxID=1330551 RepID=A0A848MF80_PAELE|nr:stalk domain-containing protein [Paenibacillus lemnae]NMO98074.1 copper amine oxidase [Paenibacillus lemnae]